MSATMDSTGDPVHTVPVSLVSQLVDLVARWHIPPDELFAGTSMTPAVVDDPMGRVPVKSMGALLQRARLLTGEAGLGYYLGLQKRVSVYGYLGFAALSAASVRQALELAVRFAPVFSTAISMEMRVEGSSTSLYLEEQVDLGPTRDIVLISLMFGLQTIGSALTGKDQQGTIELAIPEPDYYPRFRHLAPNTHFGKSANRMLFDTKALDVAIVTADQTALRLARSLCERELEQLGFDAELIDRVRGLLAGPDGRFRSLEEVAALIHLSTRTLKRRLAAQGSSFSFLAERERRERALALLRSSRLSIEDVAERLDYANGSTFVRAFHRWTGTTPAAYRRAKGGPPKKRSPRAPKRQGVA